MRGAADFGTLLDLIVIKVRALHAFIARTVDIK